MNVYASSIATNARPQPWDAQEIQLIVADYLDMLVLNLNGQRFNKAERRRRLIPLLRSRSEASIEFKRRNVSAVLQGLGIPPLQGYLPAANVQKELVSEVERQLGLRKDLDQAALMAVERPSALPDVSDFSKVHTMAPIREVAATEPSRSLFPRAMKRDYFEREAANRAIGRAGEEFVVHFERWRLVRDGFPQLAERVRHVAVEDGDGLGYDVLSFNADGSPRHVEVKTTAFDQLTPFFISSNEVRFSRENADTFVLCRVFDFRRTPRLFELPGVVSDHCNLDPVSFRASFCQ